MASESIVRFGSTSNYFPFLFFSFFLLELCPAHSGISSFLSVHQFSHRKLIWEESIYYPTPFQRPEPPLSRCTFHRLASQSSWRLISKTFISDVIKACYGTDLCLRCREATFIVFFVHPELWIIKRKMAYEIADLRRLLLVKDASPPIPPALFHPGSTIFGVILWCNYALRALIRGS